MLTTFYSFFYDKAIKGKKLDRFSLISCASFALMSLSLSKQTNLGFEGDLLNFFLGCLTVQLMKVHLMLGFIAAIFCYFVIVVRSRRSSPESQTKAIQAHQQDQSQLQLVLEIDATVRETDNSSDRLSQTLLRRRSDDDGYKWKKYEVKQVKGSEKQMSFYKCSIPSCPIRKRIERHLDGKVTQAVYKGTHNHHKPRVTIERNSSFETLYANQPLLKALFSDETPYQPLETRDEEQLDLVDSPENSSISV